MNAIPNFTPVVAALLRMYGKPTGGGYEVFIPAHILVDLSPTGEIQRDPDDPAAPGARFRYLPPPRTIEAVFEASPVEPEFSSEAALPPEPPSIK